MSLVETFFYSVHGNIVGCMARDIIASSHTRGERATSDNRRDIGRVRAQVENTNVHNYPFLHGIIMLLNDAVLRQEVHSYLYIYLYIYITFINYLVMIFFFRSVTRNAKVVTFL